MNADRKVRWLGILAGLCVIAVAVESYYLWDLQREVKTESDSIFAMSLPNISLPKTSLRNQSTPWSDDWDIDKQFSQMQNQMDNMMRQMSRGHSIFSQHGFGLSPSSPKITMNEDADKYKVTVQVPEGEDVEINTDLTDNQLTISGKVRQQSSTDSSGAQRQSLAISQFSQSLSLPGPVDNAHMKEEDKGNQIVITIPKIS